MKVTFGETLHFMCDVVYHVSYTHGLYP